MPVTERPIVAEVGETQRGAGIVVIAVFCAIVVLAAPVQFVYELATGRRLQEFDIFRGAPTLANIESYEDALAEESLVSQSSRPYVQWVTRLLLTQGNEKVVIGRDGWLFYRPSLLYPTGPGFRSHYVQADATVKDWDPLPAILDFAAQLSSRGVELVFAPIPAKAQIYPEKLTRRYEGEVGPPANEYTREFYRKLYEAGVVVIDLAWDLWSAKGRGQLYHTLDTHWTPLGMRVYADALAAKLKARYAWLSARVTTYRIEKVKVTNRGDIFDMLNLPAWSRMYATKTIEVERVIDPATGKPVEPDPSAEVVLLGDSFTNVMSMAELNWGDHAGLGEHMMLRLGRPLDVIARNGGAPSATRVDLARRKELSRKKLVIWTIVTREFITPDSEWKKVALPKAGAEQVGLASGGERVVVAEVKRVSRPPTPGAVPYAHAVTVTRYRVVTVENGQLAGREFAAVEWVMRDNTLTRAARHRPGDVHRLRLIPLADKEQEDASVRQARTLDDTESVNDMLQSYWAAEVEVVKEK